jgi:two-component system OmpR family sensor kinase
MSTDRRGGVRRVRELPGRTPLRVTLVVVLLGMMALALAVTGVTATTAMRGYLVDRVDSQLRAPRVPLILIMTTLGEHPGGTGRVDALGLPSTPVLLAVDQNGAVLRQWPAAATDSPRPRTERIIAKARTGNGRLFTVPDEEGGADWRVSVSPVQRDVLARAAASLPAGTTTIVVAVSLAEVDRTVNRLILINVVVGLAALVVLGLLGYGVIRSSLRPLSQVETTAAAIARGDLSRRAPELDPRTEVGRLGRAFNTMVTRIEAAFRAQAASEAAARASEDRMRRFVADASHELRTPLTSIRGYAELYRQGAVSGPAELARIMGRVEAEGTRMGLLVDDLLLLARLDQQRPLERRPVDLLTLAAETVEDTRATAGDRGVDLRVDGGPTPVVLGDEPRLRQVLVNLLANAVTHTPPGTKITVRVGTQDGDAPAAGGQAAGVQAAGVPAGRRALVEVADTGPGMAPEQAERVFERFYRGETSRSRAHGGAGLGLSIVAALVAAHGGTVTVHTAPGEGTAFRITLPLAPAVPSLS